jgi:hypothetical protein
MQHGSKLKMFIQDSGLKDFGLSVLAHFCNPSYLGDGARRIIA